MSLLRSSRRIRTAVAYFVACVLDEAQGQHRPVRNIGSARGRGERNGCEEEGAGEQ